MALDDAYPATIFMSFGSKSPFVPDDDKYPSATASMSASVVVGVIPVSTQAQV